MDNDVRCIVAARDRDTLVYVGLNLSRGGRCKINSQKKKERNPRVVIHNNLRDTVNKAR